MTIIAQDPINTVIVTAANAQSSLIDVRSTINTNGLSLVSENYLIIIAENGLPLGTQSPTPTLKS